MKKLLLFFGCFFILGCYRGNIRKVDTTPNVNIVEIRGMTIRCDCFFDFDSYKLSDKYKEDIIKSLTDFGNEAEGCESIYIEGYCDERGTIEYNDDLAAKRVISVMDFLKECGINIVMNSKVYGERVILVEGRTEEFWEKNRKVILYITGRK